MKSFSMRRPWAILATVALAAGLSPLLLAGTAAAATQVTVHNDAEFFDAWTDSTVTQIDLANNIDLTQYGRCNFYPERLSTGGAILLDGHGFTLTGTCDANSVVFNDGTGEALTVQNITITHTGAPTPTARGNGIFNRGSVTVLNSTITGNWADGGFCTDGVGVVCLNRTNGGGISSGSDVTVDNSTISNNRALGTGGGISADGLATVTNSTIEGNQVNELDFGYAYGGGIFAGGGATVTNSSVNSNLATCDLCEVNLGGGGLASQGGDTTITGSQFAHNGATCESACGNEGGGILTGSGFLVINSSSITDNSSSCNNDCQADGGGIYSSIRFFLDAVNGQGVHAAGRGVMTTITDSTISGNVATTTDAEGGNCDCSGGGMIAEQQESVTFTRTTMADNTAYYDGGALDVFVDGTTGVRFENSTITGNSSGFDGAIDASNSGVSLTLAYSTIDANATVVPPFIPFAASAQYHRRDGAVQAAIAGQPANLSSEMLTSFGTVVADPSGGMNCVIGEGGTTSQGYNFSDDASCGFTNTATGDQQNAGSPMLNALAGNGGPTETMLPFTPLSNGVASPLIDAIPVAACQTGVATGVGTDQRGVTRPQIVGCDIGAVEVTGGEYQVEAAVVTPKFTG